MSGRIVVLSTVATVEDAERIAGELVARRLAACVNVVPGVVSIYRWEGKVERGAEVLLVVKTRVDRFEAVRDAIVSLHAYDVPEVIGLPIADGHAPYLAWLDASVEPGAG